MQIRIVHLFQIDVSKISLSHLSEEDLRWMTSKESTLKRIPAGAEATMVLVGQEEHLSGPVMAFVRLAESVYMPNVTEVLFSYLSTGGGHGLGGSSAVICIVSRYQSQ